MSAVTTTIASFPTSAGSGTDPDGQLFIDSNGDLFGATVHGGGQTAASGRHTKSARLGAASPRRRPIWPTYPRA